MEKPYIKLEKDLGEALESYRHVFLCGTQAVGKTYTAVKAGVNNHLKTVFIGDTHKLNNEINLALINNRALVPAEFPNIINLFGKDVENIPPQIQKVQGYPPCLCPFHDNPDYYLKKLNWFPEDWCKDQCPDKDDCDHKRMISNALNSLKFMNNHVIWLMVKAYLDTDILDKFFKTSKHIGIIDENILGICFEQVTLNAKGIRGFNELADIISRRNPALREIYRALRDILKLIDNYITYEKDTDIKIKAKKITEKVAEFLASYTLKDIKQWNGMFKATALKHPGVVRRTFNIMNLIIKMFENNEEDIGAFESKLTTDPDNPVITLFISKVKRVREIVHKFHKLIFTDALLPTVITEIIDLLQIGENYKILDDNRKAKWKEVKVYKMNSKYGTYPKNTLLTLMRDDLSTSFYILIKRAKEILQFEAERDRNIGLLGSMKIFQYNRFGNTIQKELAPTVEKYDIDMSYQYYGAAPGENTYDNINWVIVFGNFNIPIRDRRIYSEILHINMDKLEYLYGPATLIQLAHRGRPLQRPNKVSAYFLTNEIKGYFEQEESFKDIPTIRYRRLLFLINKQKGITTKRIIEKFPNISPTSMKAILKYLEREKLIKSETNPVGRGRPSAEWHIVY